MVKVVLLKNIAKDLAGFSSLVEKGFTGYLLCSCALLRRVSQDTSCVLVHDVYSCDLGCCSIIVYG